MTEHPHPVPLSAAVAPERERHRDLVDAALAWQADHPRPTAPDLFVLVCAVADGADDPVSPTRWTRTGVHRLLHHDPPAWCSRRRCARPDGDLAALWRWFDFLRATGRLDPASDPVPELRKPLACAGRLDRDGRPLPGDGPRDLECECFLPYREGARLAGALAREAVERGEDALDPLRRALRRRARPAPDGPRGWSVSGP